MKTPEEIEKLAKNATKIYVNEREKQTAFLEFINGATQCQQDNAENGNNQITDKEHKDLMKAIYPKDNSKRFRR